MTHAGSSSAFTVAWNDPATKRAIRVHRRKGWLAVLAGSCLLMVATVVASVMDERSEELANEGRRTTGVVVEVSRGFRTDGSIDVRFEVDGSRHVRQINLNSDSPSYAVGDEVTVIYNPDDVSQLRTDVEENDPGWSVLVFCVALVGSLYLLPAGIATTRRARRWEWMARGGPWRSEHVECTAIPSHNAVQPVVKYRPGQSDAVVRGVIGAARWRSRQLLGADHVWVLGDVEERALLATDGVTALFETRPARTRRGRRRWDAAFGAPDFLVGGRP